MNTGNAEKKEMTIKRAESFGTIDFNLPKEQFVSQ